MNDLLNKYGVPGYADGGSVQDIQNWWAANEGKGTQADLDRWLATSGYTAAQINEALPQFSVTDLNKAIANAQAQQEILDRQARREALREQYPGQEVIVSGPGVDATLPAPSYTPTAMSTVPQSELDAARAKLDPATANYLDWYANQINPVTGRRNADNPQGANLYSDPNALRGAQEAMERAARREAMGTGYSAEWNDPNWRQNQARREAEEKAYWDRRAAEAAQSAFVAGPNAPVVGPSEPPGGGGVAPGPDTPIAPPAPTPVPPPYTPPPFTPPPVVSPPSPYTNPDGSTIYPNTIQTSSGPQPTYFPTSWWTGSPSASLAYGMTAPLTAPDFNKQMEEYRKKYAPLNTLPAAPPPAGGSMGSPAPAPAPAPAAAGSGMPSTPPAPGYTWERNPVTLQWEQVPVQGAATGGAVAELWDKYHG